MTRTEPPAAVPREPRSPRPSLVPTWNNNPTNAAPSVVSRTADDGRTVRRTEGGNS
ncbi:hypothetical protein ACFPM0_02340 [Pseudonocardia sulfidoxydans]|uniref:hypothetical protein n=1 Tax=Pseudonocardia sulfidoxydans TaxID=54011 RepID=UPI00360991E2